MKRKPLWRIAVATSLEAEDAVAELLGTVFGGTATSYFDVEAGSSLVSVYLKKGVGAEISGKLQAGLADIKFCGLDIGRAAVTVQKVRHEDWAESWKRHFKPIDIGSSLLIKPSWSKRQPKKQQKVVILDPGLSFGTGQHPTTSFCLGEVAQRVKNGAAGSFLDIGTGSGILAIAAAKLMYQPIKAFDFDPEAVRMAKLNAKTNRVEQKILITRGDATRLPVRPKRRYDLVCANLISTLLLAERDRIIAQLKQGGTLVLAGILQTEFHTVQTAFEAAGLRLVNTEILNEWQSGAFTSEKKD
jgi:ribosomal protein L11 methyltransferase